MAVSGGPDDTCSRLGGAASGDGSGIDVQVDVDVLGAFTLETGSALTEHLLSKQGRGEVTSGSSSSRSQLESSSRGSRTRMRSSSCANSYYSPWDTASGTGHFRADQVNGTVNLGMALLRELWHAFGTGLVGSPSMRWHVSVGVRPIVEFGDDSKHLRLRICPT